MKFGIDAPVVVRNLFIFGLLAAALIPLVFWIESSLWFWIALVYLASVAASLLACALLMLYSSLISKKRLVVKLIDELALKGNESILDLGCGRGLFLIESAKRLKTGFARGVDLWSSKDQSNNGAEQTEKNIRLANLQNRIELHTGDMRTLPYAAGTFDVAISSLAIHNIPDLKGREMALQEMLRVLKPGGRFMILDLHYASQYYNYLNQGASKAELSGKIYDYFPPLRKVTGHKT